MFSHSWGSYSIIGTTDTDWNPTWRHPAATKADIDYILAPSTPCYDPVDRTPTLTEVRWAAPLLAGEKSDDTSKLSPGTRQVVPAAGLEAIAGGTPPMSNGGSTRSTPLQFIPAALRRRSPRRPLKADGYSARSPAEHVGALQACTSQKVGPLWFADQRYVLAMAASDLSLLIPITEAPGPLAVEAAYVAAAIALHLEDIPARRTDFHRIPAPGASTAPEVAGGRARVG